MCGLKSISNRDAIHINAMYFFYHRTHTYFSSDINWVSPIRNIFNCVQIVTHFVSLWTHLLFLCVCVCLFALFPQCQKLHFIVSFCTIETDFKIVWFKVNNTLLAHFPQCEQLHFTISFCITETDFKIVWFKKSSTHLYIQNFW